MVRTESRDGRKMGLARMRKETGRVGEDDGGGREGRQDREKRKQLGVSFSPLASQLRCSD